MRKAPAKREVRRINRMPASGGSKIKRESAAQHLPDFMRADLGRGKENITAADVEWVGEDGKLDEDALLAKHGYEPETALDMILRAVIAAHPKRNSSLAARLEFAKSALFGNAPRGRRTSDDYEILLDIAWEYFNEQFKFDEPKPFKEVELAPLIRKALEKRYAAPHRTGARAESGENSDVHRLARKFSKDRNVLLIRVASEMNADRVDFTKKVRKVARRLQQLNVELDIDLIRPRLRQGRK